MRAQPSGCRSRASAGAVFLCNTRRRGERVRDQAGPQAGAPRAGSSGPRSSPSTARFHGRTLGALAATAKLAREDLFGPLPRGLRRRSPRDDPQRPARRGRRAHGGGDDRADPGRGGDLPDRRRGPRRRPRGLRRGRRGARLRRGPDAGWGGPGRCGPTSSCRCAPTCSPPPRRSAAGCRSAPWSRRPELGRGARTRRPRLDLRRRADHGARPRSRRSSVIDDPELLRPRRGARRAPARGARGARRGRPRCAGAG